MYEEGKSIGLPIDLMDDALIGSVERIVAVAIGEVEDSGKAGGYWGFPKLISTHDGEEGTDEHKQDDQDFDTGIPQCVDSQLAEHDRNATPGESCGRNG